MQATYQLSHKAHKTGGTVLLCCMVSIQQLGFFNDTINIMEENNPQTVKIHYCTPAMGFDNFTPETLTNNNSNENY